MTQEDKDLLLKDLCARLHYGVMVHCSSELCRFPLGSITTEGFISPKGSTIRYNIKDGDIKPYLFPISSMTEEQKDIFGKLWWNTKGLNMAMHAIDYLNKNHFDYRGLIERGLAIDATGKNIY